MNDFFNKRMDNKTPLVYSPPMAVEGVLYRLRFCPGGEDEGEGTHLSIGIVRDKVDVLNQQVPDIVDFKIVLRHVKDPKKDKVYAMNFDFSEQNVFYETEFYKIAELRRDGFIFNEDQSIRVRYQIKKHNILKQLNDLKKQNQALRAGLDVPNLPDDDGNGEVDNDEVLIDCEAPAEANRSASTDLVVKKLEAEKQELKKSLAAAKNQTVFLNLELTEKQKALKEWKKLYEDEAASHLKSQNAFIKADENLHRATQEIT